MCRMLKNSKKLAQDTNFKILQKNQQKSKGSNNIIASKKYNMLKVLKNRILQEMLKSHRCKTNKMA